MMFSFGKYASAISVVTLINLSFIGVASSEVTFVDLIREPESWVLKRTEELETDFVEYVEKELNSAFEKEVVDKLIKDITASAGAEFGSVVATVLSGVPMMSITSLLSTPRESQDAMTRRVILAALTKAKEEIIDSVEGVYDKETKDLLDSLIDDMNLYQKRLERVKDLTEVATSLSTMSSYAIQIKNRFEENNVESSEFARSRNRVLDNLHYYAVVVAALLEIQKEFTTNTTRKAYPDESDEFVEYAVQDLLYEILYDVNVFLSSGVPGSMDNWKDYYHSKFDNLKYEGHVPGAELPEWELSKLDPDTQLKLVRFEQISWKDVVGPPSTSSRWEDTRYQTIRQQAEQVYKGVEELKKDIGYMDLPSFHFNQGKLRNKRFSYTFNGNKIYFDMIRSYGCLLNPSSDDDRGREVIYVYDTLGNIVDEFTTLCADNGNVSLTNKYALKKAVAAVNAHKNDTDAFHEFVYRGYKPVHDMMGVWADAVGMPGALLISEVDQLVEGMDEAKDFSKLIREAMIGTVSEIFDFDNFPM